MSGLFSTSSRPYLEVVNTEMIRMMGSVPRGSIVLDVGCGSGLHGDVLSQEYGHRVVGVDSSEASIRRASGRLWQAHVGDVTSCASYPFGDLRFNAIVFSDILEHLYAPDRILADHLELLAPGGVVVVSIPNIAIWSARLGLLCGRFEYEDTGTFDRTHIRFFTRKSIAAMLQSCGLRPSRVGTTPGLVRPFVPLIKRLYSSAGRLDEAPDSSAMLESTPYRMYERFAQPAETVMCRLWPTLLAFQFVVVAQLDQAKE
jgi:ubiquinone/menaquinone biosynthesis C-methylase UbiE